MFDTVREFAAEQLDAAGEVQAFRRRLAEYVLALATEAERPIMSGRREAWLTRLDAELDSIRAALAWCRDTPEAVELGLRIATTLDMYWHFRDHWREASAWIDALLAAAPPDVSPSVAAAAHCVLGRLVVFLRAGSAAQTLLDRSLREARDLGDGRVEGYALLWLARLARDRGDVPESYARATECVAIFRTLDEPWALALALGYMGGPTAKVVGLEAGRTVLEESISRFRDLQDGWGMAFSLEVLAHVLEEDGELSSARKVAEEALELRRAAGVRYALSSSLSSFADLLYAEQDFARAAQVYEEAGALRRELGLTHELAGTLRRRGYAALRLNRVRDALSCLQESLRIFHERGNAQQIGLSLAALAAVAAIGGDRTTALGLASTAEALVDLANVRLPIERVEFVRNLASARSGAVARAEEPNVGGEPWTLDDATQRALLLSPPTIQPRNRPSRGGGLPDGLSEREGEVLALLAAGHSNREIADALVLSVRTVEKHVARLYAKIDARGRADAATYAVRHGIAVADPPAAH